MAPPLPETPFLKALVSPFDIIKEGIKMHHCVSGYADDPFKCKSFFYHLDNKIEEGTVMIVNSEEKWIIQQAYSICNASLSEDTWKYLNEWVGN